MSDYAYYYPSPVGKKCAYVAPPYHLGRLYKKNIPFVAVRWKASTVLNKVAYIGNVVATDADGVITRYPDTMFKSAVESYDQFTRNRMIDVSTDDGEDIIALESYADRILQFKTNNLYIINTAQGTEYLEDARFNLGVTHPYAVCKTEYGIAWANKYGCYLYDGQQIRVLTERKGRKKVKIDDSVDTPAQLSVPDWDSVIYDTGNTGNVLLFYVPQSKKILVIGNHMDTPNNYGYVCDLSTGSWAYHKVDSSLVVSGRMSNGVMTSSRDMVYASQPSLETLDVGLKTWSSSPTTIATGGFQLATKNYDFGDAARRKTIYKVRVFYRNGENVGVYISTNCGDTKILVGTLSAAAHRTHADLTTSLPLEDIFTCMVILESTGDTNAAMEIYEIDIVYRMKKIRSS